MYQPVWFSTFGEVSESNEKFIEELQQKNAEIASLRNSIKEGNLEYKILEEKYSKDFKKATSKGPVIFVGNINVMLHEICNQSDGLDCYYWPKLWFCSLKEKIVLDYRETE